MATIKHNPEKVVDSLLLRLQLSKDEDIIQITACELRALVDSIKQLRLYAHELNKRLTTLGFETQNARRTFRNKMRGNREQAKDEYFRRGHQL